MSDRIDGSKILNPGLLRHQITWQQKVVTGQNSSGEDIFEWREFLTCRASVQSTTGREFQRVMQIWAEADFVIRQYFVSGLKTDMRIAWFVDGQMLYFDVLDISDPLNNEIDGLEVVVKTFQDAGYVAA